MKRRLQHPDNFHVQSAEGWLELGNPTEAVAELNRISKTGSSHPTVLKLRCRAFHKAGDWNNCLDEADQLVKLYPKQVEWFILTSDALRRLERVQEAYDSLLSVSLKFSKVWRVPFDLSRYASLLGRFEDSQKWFKKAILVDERATQVHGIDDPDLKPLWDSMSTTVWKLER